MAITENIPSTNDDGLVNQVWWMYGALVSESYAADTDGEGLFGAGWWTDDGEVKVSGNYACHLRYTSVGIPQGAEIASATIALKTISAAGVQDPIDLDIQGNDVDDSTAQTSYDEFWALTLTTANVQWQESSWAVSTVKNTPDIKTVIQEIVDRGSWVSGNDLTILITDNTYKEDGQPTGATTNAYVLWNDYTDGIYSPLTITYYFDGGLRYWNGSAVKKIGCSNEASKFRFYKGSTVFNVPLVATTDASASKIRVYDGSAVKSLPEMA